MKEADEPEISPLVRRWMPNAGDDDLRRATENFRRYLSVVYRIYLRLEREGKLPRPRDNILPDARLDE